MRWRLMALLALALQISQVNAAPITYACSFQSSSFAAHPFMTVNQLLLDVEGNSVELRAAETMGTSNEMDWIFTNRPGLTHRDTMSVSRTLSGILGAGLYGDGVHAFLLSQDGVLRWSITSALTLGFLIWDCRP